MKEVIIASAVRTPVGKAPRGTLRTTRPDDLAATAINGAPTRPATHSCPRPPQQVRKPASQILTRDEIVMVVDMSRTPRKAVARTPVSVRRVWSAEPHFPEQA